jgi:hypothetical protein
MERRQLFILTGCLFLCLAILIALYSFSPLSKEMYRASFNRTFNSATALQEKTVLDIKYNSYYIAGITHDKIYLGNETAPFHLLITNRILTDSQHVSLRLIGVDSLFQPTNFKLTIDSPNFFLCHGTMPEILKGKIDHWEAKRFLPDSADYFVEAIPLSPSSFAFRSYSMSSKGYELAKKSITAPFTFNYDLLQKQIDGLFCVDGQLHYNKEMNQLVYLHYYRNEFIVADTNLNLRYRGHTVDTFSRARIKVAHIGSENQSMLAAPPMQINGRSCVSGKYLFVQSNLLAQNEDMEKFLKGTVIDVYDLTGGTYLQSFYLNNYQNKKLSSFKVFNNQLIAILDDYLVLYDLGPNLQIDTTVL